MSTLTNRLIGALALWSLAGLAVAETTAYRNAALPVEARVDDLLARMTLREKVAQMAMAERAVVSDNDIALGVGALLSGGGSAPTPNALETWTSMINRFQTTAAASRLGIPLLYGIDAVHGHQSVRGATLFPHQLGLAASGDEALLKRVGQVTAREMAASGIYWNFAPMASVANDIRWGRTFESFGENPQTVTRLARAYVDGFHGALQTLDKKAPRPLATAKHFIGDGATAWDSSTGQSGGIRFKIDQGDARGNHDDLLARSLPPYRALLQAGVGSVMASYSSWNGVKLHAHRELISDTLKTQLAFDGLVVSDWDAILKLPGDYHQRIVTSINAGIDMAMLPRGYHDFIDEVMDSVGTGAIAQSRIDDAVRRILRVKMRMGLFENARPLAAAEKLFGSAQHRAVAREAVRKSLVLLKNDQALPIKRGSRVLVAGAHADNLGWQAGGWTLEFQGVSGNDLFPGTTLLAGVRTVGGTETRIDYDATGDFGDVSADKPAEIGLVVVGEKPYAEGLGDRPIEGLALSGADLQLINALRPKVKKLILVLIAGRPLLVTTALPHVDALVMAWLPGSEGAGIADVLFGDAPFTGRLPIGWPGDAAQFTRADEDASKRRQSQLYAEGYGLTATRNDARDRKTK